MDNNRIGLQMRKNELEKEISSLEAEIGNYQLQQQYAKTKKEKKEYLSKENGYKEQVIVIQEELDNIESELNKLRRFKRDLFLENIDFLLAKKKFKLGALEADSGNRPGYLSRMKSGKSSSDPSIEFLMTASDELEVPLDMLVASKLTELSSTEEYILDFLRKVETDTKDDKLEWICETIVELEKLEVENDNQGYSVVLHPLYTVNEEKTESDYNEFPQYNSLFFKNCGVKPCDNGYHARLLPTDQWFYIMECVKDNDCIARKEKNFFEIYLVNYDRYGNAITKKICNTLEVSSPIKVMVETLIKGIRVSLSRVHIDKTVKDAIDAYMKGFSLLPDNDLLPFD